ncbi:hypothetical protein HD597_008637 [Nonomuraea thailandensis]|uniref:Uncharacterized protein n=1 Tax=Nonomuraea thailandensis TaxID=1188745 RepID=A0A9X2GPM9_9ACTN|nr:hypothetical protein [Nonomuraea thailandensis]
MSPGTVAWLAMIAGERITSELDEASPLEP